MDGQDQKITKQQGFSMTYDFIIVDFVVSFEYFLCSFSGLSYLVS
jgi:hypothetical protein